MKVFIADDSPAVRERLISALTEIEGLELVGEAVCGIEARNAILELNPDLVILDIRIPHRNGIDVLRDIKTANPAFKVIILTSYPYPQYRRRCMKEGADFFFDKATQFERTIEIVEQLVQETKD